MIKVSRDLPQLFLHFPAVAPVRGRAPGDHVALRRARREGAVRRLQRRDAAEAVRQRRGVAAVRGVAPTDHRAVLMFLWLGAMGKI